MGVKEHREKAEKVVKVAVLTVSDTRTAETDITGGRIRQVLEKAGHQVLRTGIVKDEKDGILSWLLEALSDQHIQAVLINGGTGVSSRDLTVDAVRPVLEKELPGFGELFRMLSYKEIGTAAMMSRALAGVAKRKVIFCLPGSPDSVHLALKQVILPDLGHLVYEVNR